MLTQATSYERDSSRILGSRRILWVAGHRSWGTSLKLDLDSIVLPLEAIHFSDHSPRWWFYVSVCTLVGEKQQVSWREHSDHAAVSQPDIRVKWQVSWVSSGALKCEWMQQQNRMVGLGKHRERKWINDKSATLEQ